jgi:hypothetical protein
LSPDAGLPSATPFSTEPVCRVSLLVPVPLKSTEFAPVPVIVPAFVTVPEPLIPAMPPLIVPPSAFVTSSVGAWMPNAAPVMEPPFPLLTVAVLPAAMAMLFD